MLWEGETPDSQADLDRELRKRMEDIERFE
jgi:hypothetical protein